jgi:hypothetical protein
MRLWTLLLGVAALLHVAAAAGSSGSSATSGTLNTLTTSCNGGCSSNGACVVVGQSSANSINCVNDTNCVTLSSGQSALCLDAFSTSATEWVFQPAESNDTAGAGPFERVGLLQLDDQVTDVTFRKASQDEDPLSGSLELSSMNIQPDATLDKVTFRNLSLSGLDSALPLNSVRRMYVEAKVSTKGGRNPWTDEPLGVWTDRFFNNCSLSSIPTAAVAGDSVTVMYVVLECSASGKDSKRSDCTCGLGLVQ